jgi:glucan 1,3-beta-glucosidase
MAVLSEMILSLMQILFRVWCWRAGAEATSSVTAAPNSLPGFPSPIRGVNLGGWLILEDWLNPNMFADTGIPDRHQDQFHFDQLPNAVQRLRHHWNTYITETDFDHFQKWGINA